MTMTGMAASTSSSNCATAWRGTTTSAGASSLKSRCTGSWPESPGSSSGMAQGWNGTSRPGASTRDRVTERNCSRVIAQTATSCLLYTSDAADEEDSVDL